MIVPREVLSLSRTLTRGGIYHAIGGGALLAHLGLLETIADWDFTTDAQWPQIEPLLKEYRYRLQGPKDNFVSDFVCQLNPNSVKIELIGGLKIKAPNGSVFKVTTLVAGVSEGLPLSNPSIWEQAYRVMGRTEKADLLRGYIKSQTKQLAKTDEGSS